VTTIKWTSVAAMIATAVILGAWTGQATDTTHGFLAGVGVMMGGWFGLLFAAADVAQDEEARRRENPRRPGGRP
jgi:hypothetical protein